MIRYNLLFVLLILVIVMILQNKLFAHELDIIVNKTNPVNDISFKDLIRIFKYEKMYWDNGKKIFFIMHESGSYEKECVLKKIYRMTNKELKKFWISKMFKGEITSFPRTMSSNESVKRFVSSVPNAVGYIDANFTDDSVKVLKINGKTSKDNGYILKD